MFATILGSYPVDHALEGAAADDRVRHVVEELDAAGIEPLSDGGAREVDGTEPAAAVAAWRFSASCTTRAVKQSIDGPYSRPADDVDALAATVHALAEAGCPLIEVAEPGAVGIRDDRQRRRFVELHRRLLEGAPTTAHLSLTVTGGDATGLGAAALFDLPYASYAFDLIAGPDNWRLVAEAPGDRGIICGALDPLATASDRPEVLVWAAHYAASTRGRGLVRVGLANASSLGRLSPERARLKVAALVDAARLAAGGSADELAAALDPRAVDTRSAALGRFAPRARRGPTAR
jgi:hypothetical protein